MIAVVTGGSGFIGHNLVRRLLADGHDVRCLVRAGGAGRPLPKGAAPFLVDYDSPASIRSSGALTGADVLFHLAGATKALREDEFRHANAASTRELLRALVEMAQPTRFVYVSSQAAAGPATSLDEPVTEAHPAKPVEAYGRSKLEAERIVESFSERVATVIVRPCAVFGPHDRDFLRLFQLARSGIVVYPGTAEHWMSLLHVDDVVNGLVAAGTREQAALRTYFLSSGSPMRWRDLGAMIAQAMEVQVMHVDLPRVVVDLAALLGDAVGHVTGRTLLASRHKVALAHQPFWVCSATRAERELEFRVTRSLPEAVRDTYLWYVEHGWVHGSESRAATVV
jgi:nucleoside-diphosphate-sugar epimerase